ncbi:hypothetical protein LUZ60_012787 [Juncus effusus]|nr:hypothetical protein LUZ60_012787 [Juncus effusus]
MATKLKFLIVLASLASSALKLSKADQSDCASYTFSNNNAYKSCTDLPKLGASIHYNYNEDKNSADIAFRAPQTSSGWIAWGLNPNGTSMAGSQAIVAFYHSNGSLVAYTTPLDSYSPSMSPAELSFPVSDLSAEYSKKDMIIYATLGLPAEKKTKYNHVWQAGSSVTNDVPDSHPMSGDNILSKGTIDFS